MGSELKPCPFCGGEAELVECEYRMFEMGYAVYCAGECRAKMGVVGRLGEAYKWTTTFHSEADAIAAWNTRAALGSGTCEMAQTFTKPVELDGFYQE